MHVPLKKCLAPLVEGNLLKASTPAEEHTINPAISNKVAVLPDFQGGTGFKVRVGELGSIFKTSSMHPVKMISVPIKDVHHTGSGFK